MMPTQVHVAVASPQQLLLDSLAHSIESKPEFHVVLRHTDFANEPIAFRENRPDLTLVDVDREVELVLDFTQKLRTANLTSKIVFLVGTVSDWIIEQLLTVQPEGCILKSESFNALHGFVARIAQGDVIFSTEIEDRLTYVSSMKKYKLRDRSPLSRLTQEQFQIFRHLALGHRVKDIAEKLQLSYKSVDSHKYRVMQKVGVHDRVELAHYAIREGMIRP